MLFKDIATGTDDALSFLPLGVLDAAGNSVVLPVAVPNNPLVATFEVTFQGLAADATGTTAELSPAILAQLGF